mmetsp:Transcript_4271/g.10627  ORF Transcript_4271/g.10627 Transcript_4271/m.10627 type:complete len:436 (-) Transcript_4271:145-1452(-)
MPPRGVSAIPLPLNDAQHKLRGSKKMLSVRADDDAMDEILKQAAQAAHQDTVKGATPSKTGSSAGRRPPTQQGGLSRTSTPASQRLRTPNELDARQNFDLSEDLACLRYMHDHLRALWYSPTLQRRMCYYCAETCTDKGLTLVGGLREQAGVDAWHTREQKDSVLYRLNTGHEMLLDLAMLRCPCGTPFQSSPQSAVCSMCCAATCSANCHKVFCQNKGTCIYFLNFLPEAQNEVHGCRDIRWCVIERCPPGTYLSRVCGPRYLEAIAGYDQNTLLLRRGYSHFGQPPPETLARMTPLPDEVQRPLHAMRLNMCECPQCRSKQSHGVVHCDCPSEARRKAQREHQQALTAHDYSQMPSLPKEHPLAVASRLGDPAGDDKEGISAKKEMLNNLKEKTLRGVSVPQAAPEEPRKPPVKPIIPIAGGKGAPCDVVEDE